MRLALRASQVAPCGDFPKDHARRIDHAARAKRHSLLVREQLKVQIGYRLTKVLAESIVREQEAK